MSRVKAQHNIPWHKHWWLIQVYAPLFIHCESCVFKLYITSQEWPSEEADNSRLYEKHNLSLSTMFLNESLESLKYHPLQNEEKEGSSLEIYENLSISTQNENTYSLWSTKPLIIILCIFVYSLFLVLTTATLMKRTISSDSKTNCALYHLIDKK